MAGLHLSVPNAIRVLLVCPVCMETYKTPIFMCGCGHPVCSRCQPRLTQCPTCRMPGQPTTRCRLLEQISDEMQVPCQNVTVGCRVVLNKAEMAEHWKACQQQFRYGCIICDEWQISRRALVEHVQAKHLEYYSQGTAQIVISTSCLSTCRFISAHENHFWVQITSLPSDQPGLNGCRLSATFIGSLQDDQADNFKFKVRYSSADGRVQYTVKVPTLPCGANMASWTGSRVFIEGESFKECVFNGGVFTSTVAIIRK